MSQKISILVINIFKYTMKMYIKYFLDETETSVIYLRIAFKKILETYNLTLDNYLNISYSFFSYLCVRFSPLFYFL